MSTTPNHFADFDRLPADALVGLDVVLQLLPVSRMTVHRHVARGIVPAPRKIGGRLMWRVADLRSFLAGGAA